MTWLVAPSSRRPTSQNRQAQRLYATKSWNLKLKLLRSHTFICDLHLQCLSATPSSKQRFISSHRERPSSTSTSTSRLHTHPPIVKLRLQNLASTSLSKSSSSTSSLVGTHRHQTFAMASLNINAQAPENGGIFPFLKLPAEIRNRIYQYTFAAPLGHLEIFDLLEPIPGGALLCRYTLVRFSVNTFADYTMLDTCKQIRAEAKAMYDCARALVQWDYYSFVLNINRPQFDGYEGQRKISKICEVRH